MKTTTTYQELMNIDLDIKNQMAQSHAFLLFNRQKIKNFQQENAIRLKILADKVNELMDAHILKDDKGLYKQKIMPDGQPNRWDFKSDEDADAFEKDMNEFLSIKISMII